jgi:DmsE family decaheme c-type cytochrome
MKGLRPGLFVAVLAVPAASALLAPRASAQAPRAPTYDVGECQTCHETAVKSLLRTRHYGVERSCDSCHGDTSDHLQKETEAGEVGRVTYLRRAKPSEADRVCLECHDKGDQAHWTGGVHERRGVSCIGCHSVHAFRSVKAQLKTARDPETCYACHAAIRSRAQRVSHHPIREGAMECSSCHEPHGSAPKLVAAGWVNDKCLACHAEKRGPFLWEHAPARENCMHCHDPHGSNHRSLLVAKQPFLCQRCHMSGGHPSVLSDGRTVLPASSPSVLAVGRSCTNCHRAVHGTNAPSGPYLGR